MSKPIKYRFMAWFVATVFLLFNVGLPVVIASCPMTTFRTPACDMCADESQNSQKLTSEKNTSCCATVVAAEKNTTEFVQSKLAAELPTGAIATMISTNLQHLAESVFLADNSPPPVFIDIPIFTSTLLI